MQKLLCESADIDFIKCPQCSREFFGGIFFQNLLKPNSFDGKFSVCESISICQTWFKVVRYNQNQKNRQPHECRKSFCCNCRESLPIGHFCYIQPISASVTNDGVDDDLNVTEPKQYIYIFYDFETQQSLPVPGDEAKKVYVVNLCVVHKICSFCFNEEDINVLLKSGYCRVGASVRQFFSFWKLSSRAWVQSNFTSFCNSSVKGCAIFA